MMKRNALIAATGLLCLLRPNATAEVSNVHRINPYGQVFKSLHKEPSNQAAAAAGSAIKHTGDYHIKEKWLQQKVDHFANDSTNQTWLMRYYVNSELYQPGGPIFIYVGGEWEINPFMLQSGHLYDMAEQHGALMFYTEHRYYGKSWPKQDATVENLKYLNVLQSLEDLKHFIEYQKFSMNYLSGAKVVLIGGSYAGSMVTWFMKIHPNLADVAWASSAPLLAKMDFYEYMDLAMQSIKDKGGLQCASNLQLAFKGLHTMVKSAKANDLLQRLQICPYFDMTNEMDINYFAQVVQGPGSLITQFCTSFLTMDRNPTEALLNYFRELYLPDGEEEDGIGQKHSCLDLSYEGMKSIFSVQGDLSTRCWFYQTCHEFGWFTTTTAHNLTTVTSENLPLAGQVPLKFFHRLCQDVFPLDEAIAEAGGQGDTNSLQELHAKADGINRIFGGLTNISQRVIFTHGLLDPWRAVGMQQGSNVLLLKDYSHVEDMGSINLSDSVAMNVAKLKVAAFINKALRE